MIFTEMRIAGVVQIAAERHVDNRGCFARIWCARDLLEHGLTNHWVQGNISVTTAKGSLRGMHFQAAPHEETKLIRCIRGAVYDVVIDLRAESPTFLQHVAVELTVTDHRLLYVPPGCAHGYQTLTDDCEVEYLMSEFYHPDAACGVRWDDPVFAIAWPLPVTTMSERDRSYPNFDPQLSRAMR